MPYIQITRRIKPQRRHPLRADADPWRYRHPADMSFTAVCEIPPAGTGLAGNRADLISDLIRSPAPRSDEFQFPPFQLPSFEIPAQ